MSCNPAAFRALLRPRTWLRGLILFLPLAFTACGDLPRPFMGAPGTLGRQLSKPPPPRLSVPPPGGAMLSDRVAAMLASAIAGQLQAREVPALAEKAHPGDWVLRITAELRGGLVVPSYAVLDPAGKEQGVVEGPSVDAAQWASADVGVVAAQADSAGPELIRLLTSIDASQRMSDPNSLMNRPGKVFVQEGTGAPGDGNKMLSAQMRRLLPAKGMMVQEREQGADFIVRPEVLVVPAGKLRRVEIQWVVRDGRGEAGRIVQINEVPPETISQFWGDIAVVVAEQATDGLRQVIINRIGEKPGAGGAPVVPPPAGVVEPAPAPPEPPFVEERPARTREARPPASRPAPKPPAHPQHVAPSTTAPRQAGGTAAPQPKPPTPPVSKPVQARPAGAKPPPAKPEAGAGAGAGAAKRDSQ